MVLSGQFVEGAVVLPADEVLAGQFADDFKAAFFLEDLLDVRQAGTPSTHSLRLNCSSSRWTVKAPPAT